MTSAADQRLPNAAAEACERLGLDPTSELWGEHRSRYRFAAEQVQGQVVLDAACGVGFGAQILGDAGARLVVGVDLSPDALTEARAMLEPDGSAFVQAELTTLPFPSGSFEVITSMETIEHVDNPQLVLAELARCLAPRGMLILSTPNRLYRPSTDDGRPVNPYHVTEFAPDELLELLAPWFETRLYGQVVDPAYRAVPFLLRPEHRGIGSAKAVRLIPWKLMNRLPFGVKDRLSWWLSGRSFYPTELDYSFQPEAVRDAHDIVAVCTLRRGPVADARRE